MLECKYVVGYESSNVKLKVLSLKCLISLNCYVSAAILKYMLTTVILRCVALIDRINTQDNFYGTQSKFMANK